VIAGAPGFGDARRSEAALPGVSSRSPIEPRPALVFALAARSILRISERVRKTAGPCFAVPWPPTTPNATLAFKLLSNRLLPQVANRFEANRRSAPKAQNDALAPALWSGARRWWVLERSVTENHPARQERQQRRDRLSNLILYIQLASPLDPARSWRSGKTQFVRLPLSHQNE